MMYQGGRVEKRLECGCTRVEEGDDVTMRHSPKCQKVDSVLPLDHWGRKVAKKEMARAAKGASRGN